MTLQELLVCIDHHTADTRQVNSVLCDSRSINPGDVFVCLPGDNVDGHDYAKRAVERGAIAVIAQKDTGLPEQYLVEDTRWAYVKLCNQLNGHPVEKLKLFGVTGTNGKTTVSDLVKQMLQYLGKPTGLIGTVEYQLGDTVLPSKHTTPEPDELYALFKSMVACGLEYVSMETSSQALVQGRLLSITFEVGAFTNLTLDHLDYHKTMENYYQAKRLLFDQCRHGVINIDDEYGRRLIDEIKNKVDTLSYSIQDKSADLFADNIQYRVSGVKFDLRYQGKTYPVNFKMPGPFSALNGLAAIGSCIKMGFSPMDCCRALENTHGPSGRVEVLYEGDFTVICDYAHSPDSMRNVLSTLRPFVDGRLICMFGCAGRRDHSKRPLMAQVAAEICDYYVITSDNPRDEDPYEVCQMSVDGVAEYDTPFYVEPDRYFAVNWLMENAQPGDVIVLCSKGHEDYQTFYGFTTYLDEHEIVKNAVKRLHLK